MIRLLKKLEVRNFRFFGEEGRSIEFGGGFCQIVANNGLGKTTLWLALIIALGGKISRKIRKLGSNGLIHFPRNLGLEEAKDIQRKSTAEIRIILNNQLEENGRPFFELDNISNEIVIEVLIPPQIRNRYRVNGRIWPVNELRDALRRSGLNSDDPLLFLEQDKTTRLLALGPVEFSKALEESIGVLETRQNLDKALKSYEITNDVYNKLRNEFWRLKEELNKLKVEYDRLMEFKKLNSLLDSLKIESGVRELLDIENKYEEAQNDYKDLESVIENHSTKSEEKNTKLGTLRADIKITREEKDQAEEKERTAEKELILLNEKTNQLRNQLQDIEENLKRIEKLKEINEEIIVLYLKKKNEDLIDIEVESRSIEDSIKEIRDELRELSRGIRTGPPSSRKFVDVLEKKGFKAVLLINLIKYEPKTRKPDEILIRFESLLGNLRWVVVIFTKEKYSEKVYDIAKDADYNDYFIIIESIKSNEENNVFNFEKLNLHLKDDFLQEYLVHVKDHFNRKDFFDIEQGMLQDAFGRRYFLLRPKNIFLHQTYRIEILKEHLETQKAILSEKKQEIAYIEFEIQEIRDLIELLKKINEEESLLMKKDENISLIKENREKIIENEDIREKDEEVRKNKQILLEKLLKEEGELETILESIRKEIINKSKESVQKTIELSGLSKTLQPLKEAFESERCRFEVVRTSDNLKDKIKDVKTDLIKVGIPSQSAEAEYKAMVANLDLANSSLKDTKIDLDRHIDLVKRYQNDHVKFIDTMLRIIQGSFSKILRQIGYDGMIERHIYRHEGRNIWVEIEDSDQIQMTNNMDFGLNLRLKKPNDSEYHRLFDLETRDVSFRHSGGEKQVFVLSFLIALQVALADNTRFYALDEPTPNLDPSNSSLIIRLLGEVKGQVLLFTPNALETKYMHEVISLTEGSILKIEQNELAKIGDNASDRGEYFKAQRN